MPLDLDPLISETDDTPRRAKKQRVPLRARLRALAGTIRSNPKLRRAVTATAVVAVLAGGAGLYFWLRPVPKPDFESAQIDTVFNYALLTDEFNALPVDERIDLVGQLMKRVRDMDSGDSVLLASFAAGIAGTAREQIMENASRLMMDVADKYATEYTSVPPEEREAFLDNRIADMLRLEYTLTGRVTEKDDGELISDARRQAKRDQEMMRENRMSGRQAGRTFGFLRNDVAGFSTPHQRARVTNFMRDAVRYLRDQDIHTGEPNRGG